MTSVYLRSAPTVGEVRTWWPDSVIASVARGSQTGPQRLDSLRHLYPSVYSDWLGDELARLPVQATRCARRGQDGAQRAPDRVAAAVAGVEQWRRWPGAHKVGLVSQVPRCTASTAQNAVFAGAHSDSRKDGSRSPVDAAVETGTTATVNATAITPLKGDVTATRQRRTAHALCPRDRARLACNVCCSRDPRRSAHSQVALGFPRQRANEVGREETVAGG